MDHNCLSCKYESTPPNSGICLECSEIPATCALWEPQITTNADRIRAMTDEELAKWIYYISDIEHDWLEWLKQAVE